MPDKKVLALDSQILNTYQLCARRCKYQFVDRLSPLVKAVALDKGGLLHEVLKVHYLYLMKDFTRIRNLKSFDGRTLLDETANELSLVQVVRKHFDFVSMDSDLPLDICEEVWNTYVQYEQYYRSDGWMPIAVEQSFSKVLFEDDDLIILYEGIIDWLDNTKIVDHKSSSRRGEPLALSNQFMGYAWAFGVHNVVINKIGFQKTLDAKDKFERYTKSYPADMIAEWRENTIQWALRLFYHLNHIEEMEKDFNLTSCDKYGGCIYAGSTADLGPCQTERQARSWKIQNKYKVGEVWSPAGDLEK